MIEDFFRALFGDNLVSAFWNIGLLLLVAALTGWIAQAMVGRYKGASCLGSMGIGIIGALLGIWLAGVFGWPELFAINAGGVHFPIVWAILGAMLLILLLRALVQRHW